MQRRQFLRDGARATIGGLMGLRGSELLARQKTPAKKRVILVWSEGTAPQSVYPKDINAAVADSLAKLRGYEVRTASLNDGEQGLSQQALDEVDVLLWWGHQKHTEVTDASVERIVRQVKEGGMGFVALHSAHFSRPFQALLGTSGAWGAYVEDGQPQQIRVADPRHPIARGVRPFTIPKEERYEEPFVIPAPEAVVFDGFYESTKTSARQGLRWTIGKGRVFYFRPGHEEYPVYFMSPVRRILRNAALWAAHDEPGIWEDCDPSASAARGAGEPPLSLILREVGYGGAEVTRGGEINAQRLVKAGPGVVTFHPLAAYGVLRICSAGWYKVTADKAQAPSRTTLWKIDAPFNKQKNPPLMPGAQTQFDPGNEPFGLWVAGVQRRNDPHRRCPAGLRQALPGEQPAQGTYLPSNFVRRCAGSECGADRLRVFHQRRQSGDRCARRKRASGPMKYLKYLVLLAACFLLLPASLMAQRPDVVRSAALSEEVSRPRWLSLPQSRLVVNPSPPGATLSSGVTDPALTTNLAYYIGETPVMLPQFLAWQIDSSPHDSQAAVTEQRITFPRSESERWQRFGVVTDFSGALRMTSTGPYGSITREATVDLNQSPTLAISIIGGTGGWAVKVRAEGEADIPLLASEGPQTGVFTADIPSITGWKGTRTFKLVLFAVGQGKSVDINEVRFLRLPGRVTAAKSRWYPHQIRTDASLSPDLGLEDTVAFMDTDTVARRLSIHSGKVGRLRLMGSFLQGRIAWEEKRQQIHLWGNRFDVTIAFSRPARWKGVRSSGVDWVAPVGKANAASGVWAVDFPDTKAGDEIVVVARFTPGKNEKSIRLDTLKNLADPTAFAQAVKKQEMYWDRQLASVPHPRDFTLRTVDAKGITAENLRRTYYRAWVFLLAGILPPMLENNYPYSQFPTGKPSLWSEGAPRAQASAQWESFVAMQALSLVMPQTAWDAYSGLLSLVGQDGSLNGEGLPSCHAQTAWTLYQATGDKSRLRANYPALKRLLLWKAANPRWIYKGSTPPTQKDQQFVLYVLQDMGYARRIADVLGMPDEAKFWKAQRGNVSQNFHRWFWETPGGVPYRIYDTATGKRSGANSPWNLTALELPLSTLTAPARDSLLTSFRTQFRPQVPFLVPGLSRWADYIGTQRGLFQYGYVTEAAMMADAGMRDVTRAGEFSETYNQGASPPTPDGVRPSVFGTRFAIDGAFWHNGVVFDEGLPVLIGIPGAKGVSGLRIRGKTLDVNFTAKGQLLLKGSALTLLRCPVGFQKAGNRQWVGRLPVGKWISLEEISPAVNNRKQTPAQR